MNGITVVGLGFTAEQLTLGAAEALLGSTRVYLHTERCGCAEWLRKNEVAYTALDRFYEEYEDFDEHASAVAAYLLAEAEKGALVYGVFDVRDATVQHLLAAGGKAVRVIPGPPSEGLLMAYAQGETLFCVASEWESLHISGARNTLIREVDSRELAAELKLKLSEHYPDETRIYVLTGGGIAPIELFRLDRLRRYDHMTSVLVPAVKELTALQRYDTERLLEVTERLLAPGGCPWDRAQTHESLRPYIVEEAYEVIDSIDRGDMEHLYDELGDMLFQVVLHSEIARRHGEFDFSDVTTAICEKMISRHTHVFGGDRVNGAEAVPELWSRNKMAERGQTSYTETLKDITRALPATLRACKAVKRVFTAFRFREDASEPARDVRRLLETGAIDERSFGELLLCVMRLAGAMKLDPELALNGAVDRLIERFASREAALKAKGRTLDELTEQETRALWEAVKLSQPDRHR